MFRTKTNFITFLLVCILSFMFSVKAEASPNSKRLAGSNRYGTSVAIALEGWQQSDYAILTNGENFPDAISSAPLAKKYNAPILLTQKDSIPPETLNAIKELKVKNIFIVGGTGVVSTAVESQVKTLGIKTTRLFGQDRYETDIKVAEQLGDVSEITMVTGEDFPDALSISPIAVKKNMPIVLIEHDLIPDVVKSYINKHNVSKIYVIGVGTSINDDTLTGLTNVEKINGQDKYQRNLAIIDRFKSDLDFGTICVASGENFPDALSGSMLAGKTSSPLFLVGNDISLQKNYFRDNSNIISSLIILGGTAVMPDDTVNSILSSLITPSTPTTPASTSFFPYLSDVPMPENAQYYKASVSGDGKDVYYYYTISAVSNNFLVTYFTLLTNNGWKLYSSSTDSNGTLTVFVKGDTEITIGFSGADVYIMGNIH